MIHQSWEFVKAIRPFFVEPVTYIKWYLLSKLWPNFGKSMISLLMKELRFYIEHGTALSRECFSNISLCIYSIFNPLLSKISNVRVVVAFETKYFTVCVKWAKTINFPIFTSGYNYKNSSQESSTFPPT